MSRSYRRIVQLQVSLNATAPSISRDTPRICAARQRRVRVSRIPRAGAASIIARTSLTWTTTRCDRHVLAETSLNQSLLIVLSLVCLCRNQPRTSSLTEGGGIFDHFSGLVVESKYITTGATPNGFLQSHSPRERECVGRLGVPDACLWDTTQRLG